MIFSIILLIFLFTHKLHYFNYCIILFVIFLIIPYLKRYFVLYFILYICNIAYFEYYYLINNVDLANSMDHLMMSFILTHLTYAGASRTAKLVSEEDDLQYGHASKGDGGQEEHCEDEQHMGQDCIQKDPGVDGWQAEADARRFSATGG